MIDTCLTNPAFAEAREEARNESWANIGNSASLTVDYLMEKRQELAQKAAEPANKEGRN